MSKNKLTLIMMTLLTVSALGGVIFTHGQVIDENMAAADTMLSVLSERESTITSLFKQIVEEGGEVPEKAQEAFEEAKQLHMEAQTLFEEADYEESLEKATEALNEYGKAETRAVPEEPEPLTVEQLEAQADTEKMVGLISNIEKFSARIGLLYGIASDLSVQGIDTTQATDLLDDAAEKLGIIKGKLESGEYDEPEIILGEANRLIGQATGMIKSSGAPMKQEKIQRFIAQTRRRVDQLNKKMTRIFNHRGISDTDDISDEFDGIIIGLDDLDTKGDLKGVIDQLKLLVKNTNKVGKNNEDEESLFDDETIEAINTQAKMEARIERYRNMVLELDGTEEFKLELNAMLDEAEGLLAQAEKALGVDDEALAEEHSEAAEDILKAFDELIDEAKEETEDKGKSGDKFDEKLEEVNEMILELESHIADIEDAVERASFEDRLDEIRSKRDEAATDDDLDEIEELLEQIEEELGIENSSGKNEVHDNDKDKTKDDSEDPEDPEESDG